jgi:subtilisin family serine protease
MIYHILKALFSLFKPIQKALTHMKPLFLLLAMAFLSPFSLVAQLNTATVDPILLDQFAQNAEQYLPVQLLFADRVDVDQMVAQFDQRGTPVKQRVAPLLTALQNKAQATQGPLLDFLRNHPDVETASIQPYWITNVIEARIQYQALVDLSNRSELEIIEYIPQPEVGKYTSKASVAAPGAREVGLTAINAPGMWNLGYTGYNRKVLIIDTGVDGDHPALKNTFLGNVADNSLAWFDPGDGTTSPNDCADHGTHVCGSVLGLDPSTQDTIGVAFNAFWMGAPAIADAGCNNFSVTSAFQWALNPDGDVNTTEDMPDVVNNSWRSFYNNMTPGYCTGTFSQLMTTMEAANVAVVFIAGNEGADGVSTVAREPSVSMNLVNVFAVGSVNANLLNLPLSPFSSLGPTICPANDSSLTIKPEVVAPGSNVRSSVTGGGYALFSGTSMAAPHVSGALLLLKEAFPNVSAFDLKMALYVSAIDMGPTGEDNSYGRGLIDVKAAYDYLIAQGNTPVAIDRSNDVALLDIFNVDSVNCNGFLLPLLNITAKGDSTIGSMTIEYAYSDGEIDTVNWTGSTSPGGIISLPLTPRIGLPSGSYRLSINILKVNGKEDYFFLDNQGQIDFSVRNESLTVDPVPVICPGSDYLIEALASSGNVVWYDQATGGSPVGFGTSFQSPALNASTSYYATVEQLQSGGKADFSGDIGITEANAGRSLVFNALSSFVLNSVKVLCQGDGIRTFNLIDSNGSLVLTKDVFIGLGPRTVDLGFAVPKGNNYRLEVTGIGNLFISTNNLNYPYVAPNMLEITGTFPAGSFYPYAYDWQISAPGMCERVEVPITVGNGAVRADFSVSETDISLPWNGTVSFSDSSSGAISWLWDFGDGNTSTQQNPVHSYTLVDTYLVKLTVTNADGCVDMQTTTIRATGFNVSLNELDYQQGIQVFPNPGTGLFSILLEDAPHNQMQLKVVDLKGRVIMSYREALVPGQVSMLDLSKLPNGIYFLHLGEGHHHYAHKIVLQR